MRKANPELQQQRRQQILDGAERCFRAKGFHQASMQDIAREAGVSMGLLYRYFENKEAIVASFATTDSAGVIALIDELAASQRPVEFIPGMIRRLARESADPDTMRLYTEVFAESLRNPRLFTALSESEDGVRQAMISAIKSQQAAGRLAQLDAGALADLLFGLVDGISLRATLVRQFKPAVAERLIGTMLASLLKP
ncbi:MAG: TetR/AcrR family transcriptional regulator [Rhodanobacteraceae bacterium]|nr:TetR/AcrR family transcriptional regulator [Rhodanobacteraceae bacterium]